MTLRRLSEYIPGAGAYTTPGAMHEWLSFYQKAPRNSDGTWPATDVLFAESWGAFRTLQGRELDRAREVSQEVEVLITVPYLAGLLQSMTVTRGTGTDQIKDSIAVSDLSGTYSFPGVPDGKYILTPTRAGYKFSPPHRLVQITDGIAADLDFSATQSLGSPVETYQILYIADPDGRQVEQRCYCRLVGQTEE